MLGLRRVLDLFHGEFYDRPQLLIEGGRVFWERLASIPEIILKLLFKREMRLLSLV